MLEPLPHPADSYPMDAPTRISITLIDKARSLCMPPTDYQLAKRLGINHATISRCRNRGGTLDNEASIRLANLLEQDPLDVIAVMEAERAKTPQKRAFWESRLPRVLPVVAYLGIITGVTYFTEVRGEGLTTVSPVIDYATLLYILTALTYLRSRFSKTTGFALGRFAT
jgi:hypothetical protein